MNIQELEKFMIDTGVVISAIPKKSVSIVEKYHIDKFPNGKIEYLEEYKREMLIFEKVNKQGGKFTIQTRKDVIFGNPSKFYNSIEEAVEGYLIERNMWKNVYI